VKNAPQYISGRPLKMCQIPAFYLFLKWVSLKNAKEDSTSHFGSPGAKFPVFRIFLFGVGRSLYKSAKFQLCTSPINGSAFSFHKDTKEDSIPNFGSPGQHLVGFGFLPLV
jgi:hypothetical protein